METIQELDEKECGKVCLTSFGDMKFYCTLCEDKFNDFDCFAVHVKEMHVNKFEAEEINMICEDSMNIKQEMPFEDEVDGKLDFLSEAEENLIVTYEVPLLEPNAELSDEMPPDNKRLSSRQRDFRERKKAKTRMKKLTKATQSVDPKENNSTKNQEQHDCPDCEYSTNLKVKLVEHVRRHFNDRPYECEHCNQRFYTTSDKNRHAARQHADKIEPKTLTPEELELKTLIKTSLIDLGSNSFKCKICNFTCEGRASIWYHIRRHSTYKGFECNICSKRFYTNNDLNTHIRSHTGEKPYLCTECGSAFSTSGSLTSHRKRHNNIRDKECSICQRRFFNKRQLDCHMAVHSDERPFACDICAATFKRQKTLSQHKKVHSK